MCRDIIILVLYAVSGVVIRENCWPSRLIAARMVFRGVRTLTRNTDCHDCSGVPRVVLALNCGIHHHDACQRLTSQTAPPRAGGDLCIPAGSLCLCVCVNARPGTTVTLRVSTSAPPLRPLQDAEDAALSEKSPVHAPRRPRRPCEPCMGTLGILGSGNF